MNETNRGTRPLIYDLLDNPMTGEAIESRSFEIIDEEAGRNGFTAEQWPVVRRILHTTADFNLCRDVRFSGNAIQAGISALRTGSRIFADSNMIRSGLSVARLRKVQPEYEPGHIVCHVADEDVVQQAQKTGLPRSLFAVRKAREFLDGGIAVFGNAPVALLELNRLIMEEGINPALVIAMPVGFVHVTESKEELMSLRVPYIAIAGRRGGSPLAVATLHALCSLAVESGS